MLLVTQLNNLLAPEEGGVRGVYPVELVIGEQAESPQTIYLENDWRYREGLTLEVLGLALSAGLVTEEEYLILCLEL